MDNNLLDKIIVGQLSEEEIVDICRRALDDKEMKQLQGIDTETEETNILLSIYAIWLCEGNSAEDFREQRMLNDLKSFPDEESDLKALQEEIESRLYRCENLYRKYLISKEEQIFQACCDEVVYLTYLVDYAALREIEMCRGGDLISRLISMRRDLDKLCDVMEGMQR